MVKDSESREDIDISYYIVSHEDVGVTSYQVNQFDTDDIYDADQSVRTSLSQKALTSWDVLTDMAEMKEIPSLVKDVSKSLLTIIRAMHGKFDPKLVRAFSNHAILDLLKHPDKVIRKLGRHWMQYRYGIMPLVYSYRDAVKAVDRGTIVRDSSRQSITPRSLNVNLPTTSHVKVEYSGDITISGTSVQRFSSQTKARLSAAGLNPINTAWELVPYSFVFDWFVNMGDYLNAHTSHTYADESQACISRHDDYTRTASRWFPAGSDTRQISIAYNYPRKAPNPTAVSQPPHTRPAEYQLRSERITRDYTRSVISLRDVALRFKPSLNWKRLTDAAVMSNGLLKEGYSKFIFNAIAPWVIRGRRKIDDIRNRRILEEF